MRLTDADRALLRESAVEFMEEHAEHPKRREAAETMLKLLDDFEDLRELLARHAHISDLERSA